MRLSSQFAGLAAAFAALALASCGDRGASESERAESPLTDPVVAATVNGKPILVDDVVAEAVSRGAIKQGEDLDPASPVFYQITEDLIETRLLALEAEARGLDKDQDVRRRLDTARERILANVLNESIINTALKDSTIERMYNEQVKLLRQGQQVRISDILLNSKDDALAAKRRLDRGEPFVALAYELSRDRVSGPEGGEVGWRALDALPDGIRRVVAGAEIGKVSDPVQTEDGWHLIKVDERRETTAPSLESMRPQIVQWLMFDEQRRVVDKLKSAARIARLNENPPEPTAEGPAVDTPREAPSGPDAGASPRRGPGGEAATEAAPIVKKPNIAGGATGPAAKSSGNEADAAKSDAIAPITPSPNDREL